MEELLARHRKEQRELQNRITQKKKQASKKTRKGVNDECDRLEAELRQKQEVEIRELNGERVESGVPEEQESVQSLGKLTLQDNDDRDTATAVNGVADNDGRNSSAPQEEVDAAAGAKARKPNRQKLRLAKRAAEQDEIAKQAAEEAQNLPDLQQQEKARMQEYMDERGLREFEIRADGHCLYSAVADQLQQLQIPFGASLEDKSHPPFKLVRAAAADYMEKHQDDFVPFLEEPIADYLHKVRDTGEWGGQLELLALAKTYGRDINVLQDFGRVEKIEAGGAEPETSLWLGYYKHGFGLGEHYNSLRKAP